MARRLLMGALGCAAGLIAGSGCGNAPAAKAPIGFSDYSLPDKSVACQSPDGWARSESAGNGIMSGADFTSGTAKVAIFSDLQGSLMADMSRASNAQIDSVGGMMPSGMQMNLPKAVPPVEKLHKVGRKKLENQYQNYDETAMRPLENQLGEARISEFTGETGGMFGKKMHGLRTTILSGERRVTVTCSCPEDDWKTLRPAFSKVLKSMKSGGG